MESRDTLSVLKGHRAHLGPLKGAEPQHKDSPAMLPVQVTGHDLQSAPRLEPSPKFWGLGEAPLPWALADN